MEWRYARDNEDYVRKVGYLTLSEKSVKTEIDKWTQIAKTRKISRKVNLKFRISTAKRRHTARTRKDSAYETMSILDAS